MKKNKFFYECDFYCLMKTFRIMRITVFLLLASIIQTFANDAYSQKTRLSLDFSNTKLVDVFDEIEELSEFYFLYNEKLVDTDREVSMSFENQKINEILERLFSDTDVVYTIADRKIILAPEFLSENQQQKKSISGKVTDETGQPLPGVTVIIKGTTRGTVTNMDGSYSLSNIPDDAILAFLFVGMKAQEISVVGKNTINVILEEVSIRLDEIVAIGYGTLRKSDLTGSVSSIKGSELNVLSTSNVASSIAGRSAGVQVVTSGSVDGSVKVRVRGIGTINNSDPLYVIDGFPTNDISYIAPSDIESMEVLKDASACAIYGSRGANGVILITTKKGVDQLTKVNVSSYVGVRSASNYLDMLGPVDYANARKEAYSNAGSTMDANQLALLGYSTDNNKEGTDWQKEVLRTAVVQNYSMSVVGGSKRVRHNLSATYNSEEGILKNSFVDKLFIKLNTEYKLYDFLKFGSDIAFVDYDMSSSDLSNMYGAALTLATRAAPVSPVFNQFGNWENTMSLDPNAVRVNDMEKYKKKHGNKFVGNFFMNIDVYKDLSFKSSFGADYTTGRNTIYNPEFFVSQQEQNTISSLQEDRNTYINWVWSNVASYNHTFNEKHKVNAMVGTEATYNNYEGLSGTAFDVLENSEMRYISAAKSNDYIANSSQGKSSIFSTFVRLNYAYNNKYLLTTTIRSDASSRFSKDKRVGVFPSVSMGWNIKKENFMNDLSSVSQMKLRAGWGQVGNQSSTGLGDYLSKISNGLKYVLGGQVYEGRIPTSLSNPNLKWEVSEQYNVGMDLGFFNGKLQLNMDYFVKKTNDMIVRAPIPDYVGASEPLDNVGNMRNNGFELTINHSNRINDFKYNVGVNLSFIKNKVTNLGTAGAIHATVYEQRLTNTSRTEVGREIAYYYGYKTDGIFNTQEELDAYAFTGTDGASSPIQPNAHVGDVKYRDLNNNGKIDESDLTYLGSYVPDFSGGFNLGFDYKRIYFSLFADFVYGNEIANMTTYDLGSSLVDKNIRKSYYENRWTVDTPNNNEPRLTVSDAYKENAFFSDRYIEDGSFFRIRNIQLGYSLPSSCLEKFEIDNVSIYLSVDNLVTYTRYSGFNPEIGDQWGNVLAAGCDVGGTPLPRTFSVGINLNF